jgi:hypothetical protein
MKHHMFTFIFVLLSCWISSQSLIPISKGRLAVSEPSDICWSVDSASWWIACGKGSICQLSSDEKKVMRSTQIGYDIEAICMRGQSILASEESFQRILVLDTKEMQVQHSISIPHGGGRNEGVEAMCVLEDQRVLLSTEKGPQYFILLDQQLQPSIEFQIPGIDEVSALACSGGNVYVLSDESSAIYQVDLQKKEVIRKWEMNIINPEALMFKSADRCIVVSDDEAMWYEFQLGQL